MENASFDIERIKKKVLRKYPAFGSIIVNCKYELDRLSLEKYKIEKWWKND